MATERQIRANRANATKSSGPRTESGKAVSRRNAVRHGLTARLVVLASEDAAAFEELRRSLESEFQPANAIAADLVEHLAGVLWRLRRVGAYEAAILTWVEHQEAEMHDSDGLTLGPVFLPADSRGLPDLMKRSGAAAEAQLRSGRSLEAAMGRRDLLTKLARYEAHLLRQVERTLLML